MVSQHGKIAADRVIERPFLSRRGVRTALQFAIIVGLLVAWQTLPGPSTVFWVSSPVRIFERLRVWALDGTIWLHVTSTVSTMLIGYVVGCAAGVLVGLVLAFLPRAHAVLSPYIAAIYALPKVALIPLYIILFGIGLGAKVAIVASAIFFQIFSNTLDGVRSVDRDMIESVRLMGANKVEITRKVLLPAALPWIFNGMRISVRDAVIYTIIAELFASSRGLGYLVSHSSNVFDFTGTFAAIAILLGLSLIINELVVRLGAAGPQVHADGRSRPGR